MAGDERPEVELARDVVARLAPGEQPLFLAVASAFEASSDGKAVRRIGGDDILGFGVSEVATFLTPIALMAAKEVVGYLAAEIGKSLAHEAASEIASRVRRLIRREALSEGLDAAQLLEVRTRVDDVARRARLPEARAKALADEFASRLQGA